MSGPKAVIDGLLLTNGVLRQKLDLFGQALATHDTEIDALANSDCFRPGVEALTCYRGIDKTQPLSDFSRAGLRAWRDQSAARYLLDGFGDVVKPPSLARLAGSSCWDPSQESSVKFEICLI